MRVRVVVKQVGVRRLMGTPMTHGSLFAGIGGFDLGFERAGIKTLWAVEIEPFCQAVLKTHWSDLKCFADIKKCGAKNLESVDIISGGFPCQDLSVAGKRKGLSASRSGLFFDFVRIIRELEPRWLVVENVPGLFSSNQGKDFRTVIDALSECGYGLAWRTLDSQFFGVAQRRRRVFVVGHFGKPCPAEVLFESESGEGDSSSGRKAGEGIARSLAQGSVSSGYRYDPNGEEYIVIQDVRGSKRKEQGGGIGIRQGCPAVACPQTNTDRVRDFARLPKGLDSARYRALGNAVTVQRRRVDRKANF